MQRAARTMIVASFVVLAAFASTMFDVLDANAPAYAQTKADDRSRELLRRAQQALKKAEQDKAALERELEEIRAKLAAAEKQAQAVRDAQARASEQARRSADLATDLDAARRDLEAERKRATGLQAQVQGLQADLAASRDKLKEAEQAGAAREAQAKRLLERAATQEKRVHACEAANAKLHETGLACIARYERDVLPRQEPFVQIERVKMENALEQYRDQLDAARIGSQR